VSKFNRGKLRHRVALETFQSGQDPDTGVLTDGWLQLATGVWAAIEPLSGREFVAAQAQQGTITTRITIAQRDDLNPKMRVRHGDVVYDVHAVLPDPDSGREWVTLMCSSDASTPPDNPGP